MSSHATDLGLREIFFFFFFVHSHLSVILLYFLRRQFHKGSLEELWDTLSRQVVCMEIGK